jgi:Na+/melibiose symporter-like transporter
LLTLLGVVAGVGFLALLATDFWARQGRPVFIAPSTLVFTLPAIAILLFGFAWPIIRYRRDLIALAKAGAKSPKDAKPVKRVDPFYAVRVLVLAKASSISASVILGWQLGVLFYLLSRPAQASDALTRTIAAGIAALVLLVAALVIERFCRLPNDSNDAEASA